MRAVSLIGPMGSGKSEVGRALARRLGWQFVDTDAEIEAREGRPVPAVFRASGEAYLREVERQTVRGAARRRHAVIATGGGAVLSPVARLALRRAGPVFYLRAPVEVLLRRIGGEPCRPMLGDDPRAALERMLRERGPLYAEAGIAVDAARPVEAVVDEILGRLAGTVRRRVRVDLGHRAYDVMFGTGIVSLVGHDLQRLGATGQVAVVTHRALARRFGGELSRALEGSGFSVCVVTVPPGEKTKSLRQAGRLYDALGAAGLTRADTVVALGGGVVGDLAGFVAGTYMRGVRLVHVPTTLLAQVDSSIGGKAAVNHPRAKNLIGVYHQPALVVADLDTLRSLPAQEVRFGLVEAVKCGMTLDRELFAVLERFTPADLPDVVYRCAALKARVVEQDEFEQGPREVLNYGHTVGHALETEFPDRFTHGAAIAVGMRAEARVAVRLGLLDGAEAARQDALLARLGLPVEVPAGPAGPLLDAMRLDKKRRGGRIRCTLPEGIGRARLGVEVSESVMEEVIVACQGSS